MLSPVISRLVVMGREAASGFNPTLMKVCYRFLDARSRQSLIGPEADVCCPLNSDAGLPLSGHSQRLSTVSSGYGLNVGIPVARP